MCGLRRLGDMEVGVSQSSALGCARVLQSLSSSRLLGRVITFLLLATIDGRLASVTGAEPKDSAAPPSAAQSQADRANQQKFNELFHILGDIEVKLNQLAEAKQFAIVVGAGKILRDHPGQIEAGLKAAYALDPKSSHYFRLQGRYQREWKQDPYAAQENLTKAVELAPESPIIRLEMARLEDMLGKRAASKEQAAEGYRLQLKELLGYGRGEGALIDGLLTELAFNAEQWRDVLVHSPADAKYLRMQICSYAALGQEAEAAKALAEYQAKGAGTVPERVLQIYRARRSNATVQELLAMADAKWSNHLEQLHAFNRVLELDPKLGAGYAGRASCRFSFLKAILGGSVFTGFDGYHLLHSASKELIAKDLEAAVRFGSRDERIATIRAEMQSLHWLRVAELEERFAEDLPIDELHEIARELSLRDVAWEKKLAAYGRLIQKADDRPELYFERAQLHHARENDIRARMDAARRAPLDQRDPQIGKLFAALDPKPTLEDIETARKLGLRKTELNDLEEKVRRAWNLKIIKRLEWEDAADTTRAATQELLDAYGDRKSSSYQKPEVLQAAIEKWDRLAAKYAQEWKVQEERWQFVGLHSSDLAPEKHKQLMQEILDLLPANYEKVKGRILRERLEFLLRRNERESLREELQLYGRATNGKSEPLAAICLDLGLYNEAVALLPTTGINERRAKVLQRLLVQPQSAVEWAQRGGALAVLGREREALEAYTQALALEPESVLARCWRAGRYIALGDYSSAEADLIAALQIDPDSSEVYAVRGALRQAQFRLDDAEKDFHQAIEYSARRVECYARLGALYYYRGELDRTKENLALLALMQPADQPLILPQRLAPLPKDSEVPAPASSAISGIGSSREAEIESLQRLVRGDVQNTLEGNSEQMLPAWAALALFCQDEDQDLFFRNVTSEKTPVPEADLIWKQSGGAFTQATRLVSRMQPVDLAEHLSQHFSVPSRLSAVVYRALRSPYRHRGSAYYDLTKRHERFLAEFPNKLSTAEDLYATAIALRADVQRRRPPDRNNPDEVNAAKKLDQAAEEMLRRAYDAPIRARRDPLLPLAPEIWPDLAAIHYVFDQHCFEAERLMGENELAEAAQAIEGVRILQDRSLLNRAQSVKFYQTCSNVYRRMDNPLQALLALNGLIPPGWGYQAYLDREGEFIEASQIDFDAEIQKLFDAQRRRQNTTAALERMRNLQYKFNRELFRQNRLRCAQLELRAELRWKLGDAPGALRDVEDIIAHITKGKGLPDGRYNDSTARWQACRGALKVALEDEEGHVEMAHVIADYPEGKEIVEQARKIYEGKYNKRKHGEFLLTWAKLKVAKGDYLAGLEELKAAAPYIEDDPELARRAAEIRDAAALEPYSVASRLYGEKKYAEAIPAYKEAIALMPHWIGLHKELSNCYFYLKDYKRQLVELDRTLEMLEAEGEQPDPTFRSMCLGWRGYAVMRMGYYEGAIADFKESLRLKPTATYAKPLGECLLRLGRREEAEEVFAEALKKDPRLAAQIEAIKNKPQEELKTTQQMYGASRYFTTGGQRKQEGDLVGALKDIQQADQILPNAVEIRELMGHIQYELGNYSAALEAYDIVPSVLAADRKIECLIRVKRYGDALVALHFDLTRFVDMKPRERVQKLGWRAAANFGLNRTEAANDDLRAAEGLRKNHFPDDPELANWLESMKPEVASNPEPRPEGRQELLPVSALLAKVDEGQASVRGLIPVLNEYYSRTEKNPRQHFLNERIPDSELTFLLTEALIVQAEQSTDPREQVACARRAAGLGDLHAALYLADLLWNRHEFATAKAWYATVLHQPYHCQRSDAFSEGKAAAFKIKWIDAIERLKGIPITAPVSRKLPRLNSAPLVSSTWIVEVEGSDEAETFLLLSDFNLYRVGENEGGLLGYYKGSFHRQEQTWCHLSRDEVEFVLKSRSLERKYVGRLLDQDRMAGTLTASHGTGDARIQTSPWTATRFTHQPVSDAAENLKDEAKIAGSFWDVTDQRGETSSWEVEFNEDHQMTYVHFVKAEKERALEIITRGTRWTSQHPEDISFQTGNGEIVYKGRMIDREKMEGRAMNKSGATWKWTAQQVKGASKPVDFSDTTWKVTAPYIESDAIVTYTLHKDHRVTPSTSENFTWESKGGKWIQLKFGSHIYIGRAIDSDNLAGRLMNMNFGSNRKWTGQRVPK